MHLDDSNTGNSRSGADSILVVEDEEMLGELLVQLLEDEGYKVLYVKDGLTALDTYEKHREAISLVLSDVGLPKMNGTQLLEKLKSINPEIKVILASGYFEPVLKTKITQLGVDGTIRKPYQGDEVLSKIREVLVA